MQNLTNSDLETVLRNSECLIDSGRINAAYDHLAAQLNLHYAGLNPLILVVMNGGLIPAGQLLTRLSFFHRMDYLHATRYRDNAASDDLVWKMRPTAAVAGEHILLIDDIYDEGVTIKAIIEELKAQNPQSLRSAVLLNKKHDRKVAGYAPDFVGCEVEDRYIYGCGMDYHGYLRHLPGIYALKQA